MSSKPASHKGRAKLAGVLYRGKASVPSNDLDAIPKKDLFKRMCFKSHYLKDCEPAYCTFYLTHGCDYPYAVRREIPPSSKRKS